METIKYALHFVLHLKDSLGGIIDTYQSWTYLILFIVIFCETGLVVTPFLPGDSLLFAAGAFAALGRLNFGMVFGLLGLAAVLGDAANYSIGHIFGARLLKSQNPKLKRIFKPEYIDRTHKFYEKYGKKAIILARFVPIVRTFIPFFAGLGSMRYIEFAAYNVIGGLLWVLLMTGSGYFLGTRPWVDKHFEMIVIAIVVISVMPMVYEYFAHRREQAQARKTEAEAAKVAVPDEE